MLRDRLHCITGLCREHKCLPRLFWWISYKTTTQKLALCPFIFLSLCFKNLADLAFTCRVVFTLPQAEVFLLFLFNTVKWDVLKFKFNSILVKRNTRQTTTSSKVLFYKISQTLYKSITLILKLANKIYIHFIFYLKLARFLYITRT